MQVAWDPNEPLVDPETGKPLPLSRPTAFGKYLNTKFLNVAAKHNGGQCKAGYSQDGFDIAKAIDGVTTGTEVLFMQRPNSPACLRSEHTSGSAHVWYHARRDGRSTGGWTRLLPCLSSKRNTVCPASASSPVLEGAMSLRHLPHHCHRRDTHRATERPSMQSAERTGRSCL